MKYVLSILLIFFAAQSYCQSYEWTAITPFRYHKIQEQKEIKNEFYCLEDLHFGKLNLLKYNPSKLQMDTLMKDLPTGILDYTIIDDKLYYIVMPSLSRILMVREINQSNASIVQVFTDHIKLGVFGDSLVMQQIPSYPSEGKQTFALSYYQGQLDTLYSFIVNEDVFLSTFTVTDDYIGIYSYNWLHFANKGDTTWKKIDLKDNIRNITQIDEFLYLSVQDEYIPIMNSTGVIIDSLQFLKEEPDVSFGSVTIKKIDNTFFLSNYYWIVKSDDNGNTWDPVIDSKYTQNEEELVHLFKHDDNILWNTLGGLVVYNHTNKKIHNLNANGISNISSSYMLEDSSLISFRTQMNLYIEVFKSFDFGITWSSFFPESLGKISYINYNPIYLNSAGALYFNKVFEKSMYKSIDKGETWQVDHILDDQWFGDYMVVTFNNGFYHHYNDSSFYASELEDDFILVDGINDNNVLYKQYLHDFDQVWLRQYDNNTSTLYLYKLNNGEIEFQHTIFMEDNLSEAIILNDGLLVINKGKDLFFNKNGDEPSYYFPYEDEPTILAELSTFTLAYKDNKLFQYTDVKDSSSASVIVVDDRYVEVSKGDVFESLKGEVTIVSGNKIFYYGPQIDKSIFLGTKNQKNLISVLFSIFPNPSSDYISIRCNEDLFYTIYSYSGEKIKRCNSSNVSISEIRSGTYIIVGQNAEGRIIATNTFIKI